MTGDSESGFMSGTFCSVLSILLVVMRTAAQETCSTVTVTGGNFTGDYEQGDGGAYNGVNTTTYVLQAISFAEDTRVRRGLSEVDGREESMLPWSGGWRQLVNDCETQMWILADEDAIEENGFPYYGAFDCADHPADINSDWIYIDCDDCAELSEVEIVCASEEDTSLGTEDGAKDDGGGDSFFTLPIIVGIAVAGLVLILCIGIGFLATMRRKKKPSAGSPTFADDSEHSASNKRNQVVAQSVQPPGHACFIPKGGSSIKGNLISGETNGSSTVQYTARQGEHDSSIKKTQQFADSSIYGAYTSGASGGYPHESHSASSHQPSRAESLERSRLHPRRDSMAEAAAAAHANLSQARRIEMEQQQQQSAGLQSVLRTGEVNRQPQGGGGVKWSAGQNFHPRVEYYNNMSSNIFPPPDDPVQEHPYECDDSVAASSPDADSMYSHFTAGGRTCVEDMSERSSDVEEDAPREQLPVHLPQDARGKPPAYVPRSVASESTVLDTMPSGQASFSPSGLAARNKDGRSESSL